MKLIKSYGFLDGDLKYNDFIFEVDKNLYDIVRFNISNGKYNNHYTVKMNGCSFDCFWKSNYTCPDYVESRIMLSPSESFERLRKHDNIFIRYVMECHVKEYLIQKRKDKISKILNR